MQHEYEKFLNVVEEGGFNDAAAKLHISQPALSIAIQNLEKELGAQLLYRSARGVKLTEAGELVYRHAKVMRKTKSNLLSELSEELKTAISLKIGTIDSIGKLIIETNQSEISTNLELTIDNTTRLLEKLQADKLDIAFITKPNKRLIDGVDLEILGREKFSLVCAPGIKPVVERDVRQFSTIYNFLSYDKNSNTYKSMNSCFSKLGIDVKESFFSTSPELIKLMVIKGKGVALLPNSTISQNLKNHSLNRLKFLNFDRTIVSAKLVGKYKSKEMIKITKLIRQELASGT